MSNIRSIIKRITQPFLKKGLQYYYRKPRKFKYQEIEVLVHPDVFPPHLTLSTKLLLDFIDPLNLERKSFLELGCGSGVISLFAAKKKAVVTASDINPIAIEYLLKASQQHLLKVNCILSNLFELIPQKNFDFIIINPPYYPKKPASIKEQAWFCGENFEYFFDLFKQLPLYLTETNKTFMILSEDCDVTRIQEIASTNGIKFEKVLTKRKMGELNYIFKLSKVQSGR